LPMHSYYDIITYITIFSMRMKKYYYNIYLRHSCTAKDNAITIQR
jgi:hypothetical protein